MRRVARHVSTDVVAATRGEERGGRWKMREEEEQRLKGPA